jgi:hypothetical protein
MNAYADAKGHAGGVLIERGIGRVNPLCPLV